MSDQRCCCCRPRGSPHFGSIDLEHQADPAVPVRGLSWSCCFFPVCSLSLKVGKVYTKNKCKGKKVSNGGNKISFAGCFLSRVSAGCDPLFQLGLKHRCG